MKTCHLFLLLAFLVFLGACAKQSKPENFGPWTTRVVVSPSLATYTSDETLAWAAEVREDLQAVKAVLLAVLEESKTGNQAADERLTYLKEKLENAEDFRPVFLDDDRINATIIPESHTIEITKAMMQQDPQTRRFVFAHELGHLLSLPAYIGQRGTRFLRNADKVPFTPGRGQKFAAYTIDNYPFLHDLNDLKKSAHQDTEGLEYLDPAQRKDLKERAFYLMNKCRGQQCQVNNLFVEEYRNFDADRMVEGLILNNAFQKAMNEGKVRLSWDSDNDLAKLNSRIDEVNADLFASFYVKKMLASPEVSEEDKDILNDVAAKIFPAGQSTCYGDCHPDNYARVQAAKQICSADTCIVPNFTTPADNSVEDPAA